MKTYQFFMFPFCCLLLGVSSCAQKAGKTDAVTMSADTVEAVAAEEEVPVDQSAGLQIIEALSKAWGNDPGVVGGFIGNLRCPSYLEGMYFDGETLVFQVRGDTLLVRRELEKASGSAAFRLEQVRDTLFSQKELDALMEVIRQRWDSVAPAVRANVIGYGTGLHTLDVRLILDTPERRQAFREQVLDSPALRFSGSTGTEPCDEVGTSDTLGMRLMPEFPSFPAGAKEATFLLYNESPDKVLSGEHYKLAYERAGRWYWLPINDYAVDIGHITPSGGTHRFTGRLYPLVNDNHPGLYRFFTEVWIGDKEVLMMAEFRLE